MNQDAQNLFTMFRLLVNATGIQPSPDVQTFLDIPDLRSSNECLFPDSAIESVIGMTDDPQLGLKFSRFVSPNVFQGLGYLFMTAANLADAFHRISELPSLYHNVAQFQIVEDDNQLRVHVDNGFPQIIDHRIVNEGALAILVNYLRWVLNGQIQDLQVFMQHPPLSDTPYYQEFFGLTPQFSSPWTALSLPLTVAQAPLHSADPIYHQHLLQKLRTRHERQSNSIVDRTRRQIREGLARNAFSKTCIAERMRVSTKTLDRRLQSEGSSYRELIQQTRMELAPIYLANSKYSLDYIADQLGYSDRSAFSKAYKGWFGVSPRN